MITLLARRHVLSTRPCKKPPMRLWDAAVVCLLAAALAALALLPAVGAATPLHRRQLRQAAGAVPGACAAQLDAAQRVQRSCPRRSPHRCSQPCAQGLAAVRSLRRVCRQLKAGAPALSAAMHAASWCTVLLKAVCRTPLQLGLHCALEYALADARGVAAKAAAAAWM